MTQPNHGFLETRSTPLPELNATLHEMEHQQTGARLAWLGTGGGKQDLRHCVSHPAVR